MLAIRMQRTGRKGHAMFRVVVQDRRRTPTSGKVVAYLGSYDPHSKNMTLAKDKADFYLKHGAQPSPRLATLLKREGIALPAWVAGAAKKASTTRHPEKLRRNQPAEAANATPVETVPDLTPAETQTESDDSPAPSVEQPQE